MVEPFRWGDGGACQGLRAARVLRHPFPVDLWPPGEPKTRYCRLSRVFCFLFLADEAAFFFLHMATGPGAGTQYHDVMC